MNEQPLSQGQQLWDVFHQYGWEPTFIQYAGGVWRVACQNGTFALKQSKASREKLLLLHRILEGIRKEGYNHVLPWVESLKGEPVVTLQNRSWYATPWKSVNGLEEMSNQPSATELVKAVAQFHRLSETLVKPYPELFNHVTTSLLDQWKEKQAKIAKYHELSQEKEFHSPFEKSLTNHKENVDRLFTFSIRGMERFIETENGNYPRYALCHRRMHPSNVIQENNQFYFIDFDHAQVDTPVRDLATILRRFTFDKGNPEKPFELIEVYESEWTLHPKEKKLLALYLAYPERLLKTISQYYDQPHTSEESQAVKRLEAEVAQFELLQEVIKNLWTTKKTTEEKQQPDVVPISKRSNKKKDSKPRKS